MAEREDEIADIAREVETVASQLSGQRQHRLAALADRIRQLGGAEPASEEDLDEPIARPTSAEVTGSPTIQSVNGEPVDPE